MKLKNKKFQLPLLMFLLIIIGACQNKRKPGYEYAPQMYNSIPYNPDQPNPVFIDNKTARVPPEGSVPKGFEPFTYTNTIEDYEKAGQELRSPIEKNKTNFDEGKKLYLAMCSHCHGKTGKSDGLVVSKGGFPPPPSYSSDQLKNLPEGKMFFSITYGKNAMGPHASQLSKEQRWKIIQYVQYLQNQ